MEILIGFILIGLFIIYGFIIYNKIISLKNTREQSFADIDVQLKQRSDLENKIAGARRFFNSATNEYNTYIQQLPNNIIAGFSGFKQETMFNITNENERENIKVEF